MRKIKELIEKISDLEDEVSYLRRDVEYIEEEFDSKKIELPNSTLVDEMKIEFLKNNWDKITLEQLESLLK